mmetsp:Transcript_17865/g.24807  ORF Transcript_17865/g.24807 Transcript_17865/m.24807 type:complete len:279 (+) Transcript_17865:13-849(+)
MQGRRRRRADPEPSSSPSSSSSSSSSINLNSSSSESINLVGTTPEDITSADIARFVDWNKIERELDQRSFVRPIHKTMDLLEVIQTNLKDQQSEDEEQNESRKRKLLELFEGCVGQEFSFKRMKKAVDNTRAQSSSQSSSQNFDHLEEQFADQLKQLDAQFEQTPKTTRFDGHKKYQDFVDLLGFGDSELQVTETHETHLCPILKCPITEAMKNVPCGHTYSKDGIFGLLKKQSTINCPVSGCAAQVRQRTLEEDRSAKWRHNKRQKKTDSQKGVVQV